MLQVAHTTGKNSSDSALIIDAMDLLYSDNVDAFALVSSDSDFTSLAIRLRGSGRTVYGLGLRKTPKSLRQAVDRFIYLEDLHETPASEDSADDGPPADQQAEREVPDLPKLLDRAIKATANDDGWASLSSVANHITRVEPSFSVKDYGSSKLIDLVRSQSYVEVEQPKDGSARVRLTSSSHPAKKAAAKKTGVTTRTRKRTTAKKAQSSGE